jgi:hypothetical protein
MAAVPAVADDVYLRGGGQITGQIIEQTDELVTVDIGGGSLTVNMSSVVRIEQGTSPLQEYRARAERIQPGDAEGWRELARWAEGEMLSSQAAQAWGQVLASQPDDEEANRALGRVRLDGRWVSEEESYIARGYVEFEGQWMTPQEQQAILADRQAREEAARKANQERIQAIEAEQQAQRERQAAEREAAQRDNLPQLGDPVFWGWGPGPSYWPSPVRPVPYGTTGSTAGR